MPDSRRGNAVSVKVRIKVLLFSRAFYFYRVSVVCKPGEFESKLRELGVQVITTSFDSIQDSVTQVLQAEDHRYDIVHTHPGASRKVGMLIA